MATKIIKKTTDELKNDLFHERVQTIKKYNNGSYCKDKFQFQGPAEPLCR